VKSWPPLPLLLLILFPVSVRIQQPLNFLKTKKLCSNVLDPDPYVYVPPGFGSVSHMYGSGSFLFLIKVLSGLKNGITQDSDSVHSPVSFQNRNSKDGERIEKTSKGAGKTTIRQRKQGQGKQRFQAKPKSINYIS
jgi:hypothetical protein